ncbi:MAG: LPS export ABC transporter periplasmic protein LptC [Candidatus Omnitrophica bacterium]|jgi:lipopolysaccharide export system protein LptA|nr:LPS export ABC transporter periplasmic protein LptC [Candidatus Omnitrophota bacterium]
MYFGINKRIFLISCLLVLSGWSLLYAEDARKLPIIINGDNVEYSADSRSVVASGKVEVIYKESKLTCNKLTVNMETKDAVAEGNARLDDKNGVIEGEKLIYNFQNKTGTILNADFRVNPYFGKAKKVEMINQNEYSMKKGYFTTCSLDHPHYRINSKKIGMFPGDKVQSQSSTIYLGSVPLLYLPRFNYSMQEALMHMQVEPGKSKDWGAYLLSNWRYNLNKKLNVRMYLDYRNKLGLASGFNVHYDSIVGKGDYKFYYTNEKPDDVTSGDPSEYQRYFMRLRHKWNIDERTNFTAEFLKITDQRRKYDLDRNFLKDYFFREYEKDAEPLSYALFHHVFNFSSIDILLQKRTNHWFDQVEKMPEVNYNLPSMQLGESPLYFENSTQVGNYNKRETTIPKVTLMRMDTTNKVSMPMKVSIFQLKPFVASRQTFYDTGSAGQSGIVRTIFYGGIDASTKFYRIYNTKTNFLGMDINGLRHIITPSVGYLYTHQPTIPGYKLRQIDSVDSITRGNTATLTLINKLQTKRKGVSVDFVDFQVSSDYVIKPKSGSNTDAYGTVFYENDILRNTGQRLHSDYSDILFKLKILPYSWMRIESEATYEHSDHDNVNYNTFSLANYDLIFDIDKNRSFSVGQRYERKGKNEVTAGFHWKLSPKWRFSVYERYNFKQTSTLDRGLSEQEYTLTRDLHCWEMDLTWNSKKGQGSGIYFTFRLKAFPGSEFGFNQTISESKSGAQ